MIETEKSLRSVKNFNRKGQVREVTDSDPELSVSDREDDNSDANPGENDPNENGGSSDEAGSEDSTSQNKETSSKANPGWADVMQKILNTNKPKKKKTIVLSKAKKLSEVKSKATPENVPFEIQNDEGESRKEVLNKIKTDGNDNENANIKRRRKEVQLGIRIKPSILDRERERLLQKIATKGVVQLFNVVKQQQTEIDKKLIEAGPLERKREQVLKNIDKRGFLDVLMGGSKNVPVEDTRNLDNTTENEDDKTEKVWNVLRDDFVMGAKLKDWDKKAPNEDDSTSAEEMDSD